MQTQINYQTENTIITYFPYGNIQFLDCGKVKLIKKDRQEGNTCWFDGAMMVANLLMNKQLKQLSKLQAIEKYKKETEGLFFLNYCFIQFVNQFDNVKLKQLCEHPNILEVNFSPEFIEQLTLAIQTLERKKILFDHIKLTIQKGKTHSSQSLGTVINKAIVEAGHLCLSSIDLKVANNIHNINLLLSPPDQNCLNIQILQKDAIVEAFYSFLHLTQCKQIPNDPQRLYNLIESFGSLYVGGKIGIESYKPNTDRLLSKIGKFHIFGWDKENYVGIPEKHCIVVIGVNLNKEKPELTRVYFYDPRQTLNPADSYKKVFSVSFAKFIALTSYMFIQSKYAITEKHIAELEGDTILKPISPTNFHFNSISKPVFSQVNASLNIKEVKALRLASSFFYKNEELIKRQNELMLQTLKPSS